jgi:adenylate cyclase
MVAFAQERYADSVAEFTEVGKSVPRSELVLEHLAAAYAYLGDKDKAEATVTELQGILPITNLGFYAVLRKNVGTSEQISHFIEGLRRAGIPEWPYGDERRPEDRLGVDELRTVIKGPRWVGELKNGVSFVQEFEGLDGFGYSSIGSMLTGRVAFDGDRLCQVIKGYLLDRPSCGYVYRNASDSDRPGLPFVYVSIDAVKYFAVSD